MDAGKIAAAIHADMCKDNSNGYSWSPRWGGDGNGIKTLKIDGKNYTYAKGSYDCSSSCITAWRQALSYTKHAHMLDGATYTANMKNVFLSSGLFEWKSMNFIASTGDLYLNEANHVAMCQSQVPDRLSEFSSNEKGGVYGGKVGDQTGREAWIHEFYNYPFDGILHYNGKANLEIASAKNVIQPIANTSTLPSNATSSQKTTSIPSVRFRVKQGNTWLKEGKTGDNKHPLTAIAVNFKGNGWYQVCTKDHGWLEPVTGYDVKDEESGYAGFRDSPIVAIRCYYQTPKPEKTGYFAAKYRVSDVGSAWYPYQYDDDSWNGQDGYAGDMKPIGRFQIALTKC